MRKDEERILKGIRAVQEGQVDEGSVGRWRYIIALIVLTEIQINKEFRKKLSDSILALEKIHSQDSDNLRLAIKQALER